MMPHKKPPPKPKTPSASQEKPEEDEPQYTGENNALWGQIVWSQRKGVLDHSLALSAHSCAMTAWLLQFAPALCFRDLLLRFAFMLCFCASLMRFAYALCFRT